MILSFSVEPDHPGYLNPSGTADPGWRVNSAVACRLSHPSGCIIIILLEGRFVGEAESIVLTGIFVEATSSRYRSG